MRKSYTFKIGGPAGFGIMTTGAMFSRTATRSGFHIFDYVEYPSLIRGGHNVMETHFAKEKVFSQERGVDLLIPLNRESALLHIDEMKDGSAVVYDADQFELKPEDFAGKHVLLCPVPFKKITEELGVLKLMENNVALGAAVGMFGLPKEALFSVIEDTFNSKGEKIVNENKQVAERGYTYVQEKQYKLGTLQDAPLPVSESVSKNYAVPSGNEIIGMGALAAGCQFYTAYPMTPSSSLLHYMASHAKKAGMVVRHAEDEIGVINEAIGASFAGVRAMLGTSGGGFALMNEAVSFAGVSETGLVIYMGQRPGPATGLPTWTEQGDLQFVIHAGHGEFPKIVLAPGDVEEAYLLTIKAFNLADMYQTPVIILSDTYLAESHESIEVEKLRNIEIKRDRGKIAPGDEHGEEIKPFQRYEITEDGISPRIFPGTKGYYYQANSYEHIPDGHTTEDAEERIKQVDKRNRKWSTYLARDFKGPKRYGPEEADVTLVCWGSMKAPALDALTYRDFSVEGKSVNVLHFTHVWPLDQDKVAEELKKSKRLAIIENNSWSQFGQLLRQETGIHITERLLKYSGRPIYPEEVTSFIQSL